MNKKLLASAVAGAVGILMGTSAMAVPPTMGQDMPNEYALETVEENGPDSDGLYRVQDSFGGSNSTILGLVGSLGWGIPTNTTVYFRLDLSGGAQLVNPITVGSDLGALGDGHVYMPGLPAGANVTISAGGASGDDHVILAIQTAADGEISQDQNVSIYLGDGGLDIPLTDVTVTKRVYDDAADASAGIAVGIIDAYVPDTPFIDLESGFEFTMVPRPQNLVADVLAPNGPFTEFEPEMGYQGYPQSIGYVQMQVFGNDADDGEPVSHYEFLDGYDSTLTLTGPFEWADEAFLFMSYDTDSDFDSYSCHSYSSYYSTDFDIAEDNMSATVSLGDVAEYADDYYYGDNIWHVCLEAEGDIEIPEVDSYPAEFEPDDDAIVPGQTQDLAGIDHNGTKFRLELGSNFETYNQKLVLVNKSDADAPYHIEFTSEEGVTASAGEKAMGTIPANGMLVIKQSDIVTWEGKSRGSYCVVVAGDDREVGAMHISTNVETGDEAKVRLTIEATSFRQLTRDGGYYYD